jgi:hypothetical protein
MPDKSTGKKCQKEIKHADAAAVGHRCECGHLFIAHVYEERTEEEANEKLKLGACLACEDFKLKGRT